MAAGLCSAVLLCGFAIPAYAYSDSGNEEPPVVEETPAPEPAPTITPGEGFSEDGNLVTRDLLYDAATNKQFITVETTAATPFTLSLTMTSLWTRTANSITPTF
ncbi:bacteriocin [human gut metagenome]|uniref:Bacteriocin n=1 Tax=human gut metagenome TaxID=408170 RepID=K1U9K0_9ZZZZ